MLKITATGNLTNDVELRTQEDGRPYAILRIASDRRYRAKDGTQLTDFVSIKVRGHLAERCAAFAWKGCKLAAAGDFETVPTEPGCQPGFLIKGTEVEFLSLRRTETASQANPETAGEMPESKEKMPMNDKWTILQGDALKLLGNFSPSAFDAVITDPPYASGGRTQAEKNKSTARKYSSMGDAAPPPFDGDSKDQRSWTRWAAEWLADARRLCRPGAPVCMFIDWRQLPAASDALQWAGWIWRGTAVWDKGNSRPQKGHFRQQAEYIVWGSNGDMPINRPVSCLPGVFKYGNPQNHIHLTEKPLQLMRDIVKITEPGGHILDPFAGSGTTVLAAVLEGYSATGIEITEDYARLARERIVRELREAV